MATAKDSQKYYQSQKAKGLTQIKVWVPCDCPEIAQKIREFAAKQTIAQKLREFAAKKTNMVKNR